MKKHFFLVVFALYSFTFAQITFDANFESGNIKSVQEIDSVTFYVTTQEDVGINGGNSRWFYFRISGVMNKAINVLITNSDVTKAMYSYDNKNFTRFSDEEAPNPGMFLKTFDEDTVYIAYYTPYTFGYLQERINFWKTEEFVSIDTIGVTPKGLPIQKILITDFSIPASDKKTIWIHARTHPGETPSSWHFDGIVQELLSNNEVINFYLSKFEFHLIPFVNPDGVYYGRSRVNYEGINLESNWNKNEAGTSEEVKILRANMKELNDEKPFSVFLNLHSQKNSWCTFWIHKPDSTSELFYRKEYQFANLNVSDNPYFTFEDYSESTLRSWFPEGWLWNNYGDQVMALTYETPYNNYFRNNPNPIVEVTNENLFEIGRRTIYAIAEYLEVSHPKHYIMDNSIASIEGDFTEYSVGTEFYSDNFIVLDVNSNSSVTFNSENLPNGKYDVSAWWPTSEGNSYETKFEITSGSGYTEVTKTQKVNGGQWNYIASVELNNSGTISIKMNSNSTGLVVADAFRLLYSGPVTSVHENNIPADFVLYQNYPNPFNPATTIKYSIPALERNFDFPVKLTVYDMLGKEVATLVNERQTSGTYNVTFDASGLASGTYFYRLQIGKNVKTKKMLMIK